MDILLKRKSPDGNFAVWGFLMSTILTPGIVILQFCNSRVNLLFLEGVIQKWSINFSVGKCRRRQIFTVFRHARIFGNSNGNRMGLGVVLYAKEPPAAIRSHIFIVRANAPVKKRTFESMSASIPFEKSIGFYPSNSSGSAPMIAWTLPTCPSSSITLIPRQWFGLFVKILPTVPLVSFPVGWSFFRTISTRRPGWMWERS